MPTAIPTPIAPYFSPSSTVPTRSPSVRNSPLAGSGCIHATANTPPIQSRYHARRRSSEGGRPQRSMSSYSAALKRSASNRRITSSSVRPSTISIRSWSGTCEIRSPMSGMGRSMGAPVRSATGATRATPRSFLAHAQDRQEGLLGDLDGPHALHPLLPFLLLLEELPLAGDVATVALRKHVLAHGPDRLPGHDVGADGGLDRHLEHLARDQLAQLVDELAPRELRAVAVDDEAERVHGLAVDEDVELHEV